MKGFARTEGTAFASKLTRDSYHQQNRKRGRRTTRDPDGGWGIVSGAPGRMLDMTSLDEQFAQRQIDPRISAVIEDFARSHTVVTCITEVDNFRLSVAPDAYAAVYPSPAWMDVALSPEEARAAERQHGLPVTKSNDTTAYLRIAADFVGTDAGRAVALELLDAAWDKAFHGPRWDLGLGEQSGARGELCEVHFLEKPVSGECPLCE